ncbi:MAG TPA: histidine kinase [Acidimicrobiales bacterium]|nr:histidine kinase [Acidimicrobiales bacterium]
MVTSLLPTADVRGADRTRALATAGLAAAAAAGTIVMVIHGTGLGGARSLDLDVAGVLLVAVASLPLVWWRRAPLAVFVFSALASAPLLRYEPIPPLGPTIALYLLAATRDARHPWTPRTTLAVAVFFSLHLVGAGLMDARLPLVPLLIATLGWAAAWVAGDRSRLQRERLADLEDRAARADREVERERRLTAAEERMRIARDLHDSAGHAINVILVQAGAARLLHERDPARSLAALETIEDVARQTIGEIDELVATLRDTAAGPRLAAPNGLAAADALVARHRANGLDVTLDRAAPGEPPPGPLPPTVDQAAFRILQEALTNAARHGSGSAHVVLHVGTEAVEVTVTNPVGRAAATGTVATAGDAATVGTDATTGEPGTGGDAATVGDGHGLVGMRERAALLGGRCAARRTGDRFEVRARLPLPAVAP